MGRGKSQQTYLDTIDVAAGMVVAQYAVKLAVALADTPIFYLLTRFTDSQ